MIITNIMGGLGNQMFCHAAGRAVAERHGVRLLTDARQYPDSDGRQFDLLRYHIQSSEATEEEIKLCKRGDIHSKIFRALRKYDLWPSYGQRTHFIQRGHAYDAFFPMIGPRAYMHGLFQSERFFENATSTIRAEFTLRDEHLTDESRDFGDVLSSSQSVSLHVRRSDYLNHPVYSSCLQPCPREYYQAAIGIMRQHLAGFRVFVFSDDPEWCRENLDLPCSYIVMDLNPPDKPWLDLYLMTRCKHHIIANSTFSWWGAWLAASESQIVIAPSRWMKPTSGLDDRDIVPERWIKV